MAMSGDLGAIVESAVTGLGYELVDIERTASGLLRVFIDKVDGITVEDCADVSNHLSRVFAVESIDFSRLEISSPGLDRPVKKLADFKRFVGHGVKVKLNTMVERRKRFDGFIRSVTDDGVVFALADESAKPDSAGAAGAKQLAKSAKNKKQPGAMLETTITVPLASIERARLVPEI